MAENSTQPCHELSGKLCELKRVYDTKNDEDVLNANREFYLFMNNNKGTYSECYDCLGVRPIWDSTWTKKDINPDVGITCAYRCLSGEGYENSCECGLSGLCKDTCSSTLNVIDVDNNNNLSNGVIVVTCISISVIIAIIIVTTLSILKAKKKI